MTWDWDAMDPAFREFVLQGGGVMEAMRRDRSDPFAFLADLWFPDGPDAGLSRKLCVEIVLAFWQHRQTEAYRAWVCGPPYRLRRTRIWGIEFAKPPAKGDVCG